MKTETIVLNERYHVNLSIYILEKDENPRTPWQPEKRPAMLILPGGSYMYTSPREGEPVALTFLQEGYQCFVLDYRVREHSDYPNPLEDVASAMNYIIDNAERFFVDTNKIVITGFSAGGHLALLYQSMQNPDWPRAKALISIYPIADYKSMDEYYEGVRNTDVFPIGKMLEEYREKKDPGMNIHHDLGPLFIAYLANDELIPAFTTSRYITKLLEHGIDVEAHMFRNGSHGLSVGNGLSNYSRDYQKNFSAWVDLSKNWLCSVLDFDLHEAK